MFYPHKIMYINKINSGNIAQREAPILHKYMYLTGMYIVVSETVCELLQFSTRTIFDTSTRENSFFIKILLGPVSSKVVRSIFVVHSSYFHYCTLALRSSYDEICLMKLATSAAKFKMKYRKFPKYSDIQNSCCNHSKI